MHPPQGLGVVRGKENLIDLNQEETPHHLGHLVRASSARSLYSLLASPFAGSPANGSRKRRGGGPALRPQEPPAPSIL